MTYSEYVIEKSGPRSYRISLPCFRGEDDFFACSRMNRFYESAAGDLYKYALSTVESAERRARFSCLFDVTEEEGGTKVVLHLSCHKAGERSKRKSVTHVWKNGNIVMRSAE